MADNEESCVVIFAFGVAIVVAILMLAWAVTGGLRAPVTVDNCPVEMKGK